MSEIQEKLRIKVPWVFKGIRIPKINFPSLKDTSLGIPTPSKNIILILLYAFLFFLISGGVYLNIPDSLGRKPIALGSSGGSPMWVYPSINDAFVIESFVAASVIFIGAFGFLILFQSSRNLYQPSYAQKLILIGLLMAIFSFVYLQFILINFKATFLLPD
ncbi:MAG: hypothetical protein ACTSWY_12075 [Promethearchaeota archaeon]